ncbi:proteoglycan 4-like isoform X11 [Chironomus tepperi]|uniref:proteoglycan 4-like isoform X11 n=1 Tax=Chironomus tepperi TaxID=113505 RepID=UPI00391FBDC5
MKFDVVLIVIYSFAFCGADISLNQQTKNQFEPLIEFENTISNGGKGYDYPKPKIAFPLPSETTKVPPTPKVAVKAIETIPSTYLPPPETTTTKKSTTTTTTTTTRRTTTQKPTEKTIIKEDIKEGYDYPKPKIAFPLPSETTKVPPTPKVAVKAIETIPSTYLPPLETTTTKKPTTTTTTTTTRRTTTQKPTEKTIIKEDIKEGYDYPKPKIAFPLPSETTTLPPTPKVAVKAIETIPSTYLPPPTIPSTYLPPETTTTKKPTTTTTTPRRTTTQKPTEKTIIKEDIKEGYDYPKPKIAFPLPSETTKVPPTPKVAVKAVETIPSTYLPPLETTTTKKPTTTTTTTTTRRTTTQKPTEKTIIKEDIKEGYDYPKPKIAFPLPSETTTLPPTPKVAVKAVETIPSTYLPPLETTTTKKPTTTTTTTTTRRTTTQKPTEKTIIKEDIKEGYDYPKPKIAFPLPSETTTLPPTPKVAVKAIETIPSTYLPPPTIPSTYLPPETTTTKKPTTTTTTTRRTTTQKPTEKTIIKEDIKEGYDYPKPKIAFPLPSETTTLPPTPKVAVKAIETIPSTYLPPPETTTTKKPTTTTTTTTTRRTTTQKPTEKTIIKEDIKEGYDYPKPKIAFPLPSETTTLPPTPKVAVKAIETIPSTYLPPPETTTTKKPTTTTTTTTTTRRTTTQKPTEKTIIKEDIKEGYDYPKPKIAFPLPSETTTLPPTSKVAVKAIETIPSTYLPPPTIPSTYLPPETTTTKKPTTTTTTTTRTTTQKPTEKTIIKEDIKEGYDYPKPKIAFPLPSETTKVPPTPKVAVKAIETIPSTYLPPPTIPSTYLPPETTTTKKPTTTTTTTRRTTTQKPTEKTIIKEDIKEGYDYPKPKIAFPLPSETIIPSTYLPPSFS